MADTAEQIAYDNELATIEAMPAGEAKSEARLKFKERYPKGRPGVTPEQKAAKAEASAQAFGFLKKFLDEFPDDSKLKESWALLLENDIAGAKLAFQESNYYQNTLTVSDARLKRKLSQFGVYTKELATFMDEQARRLVSSGLKIDINDDKVKELLESAYLSGDTNNQIDIKALAFNQGKSIGGSVGGSVTDLRQYAAAFGIKYTDADYIRFSEEIFSGKTTGFDIQAKIRQDSASAYPVYADQILKGTSINSIGSAYKASYANILELDANAVDWTSEPLLRKALQYTVDGKPAVMPVWQFEEELRKDPRWQYTNQARSGVFDAIYQVKLDMGLI